MSLLNEIGQLFGGQGERRGNYQEDLLRSLLVMAWMVEARDPYTHCVVHNSSNPRKLWF